MKKFVTTLLAIALLAGGMTIPAGAALNAVGPISAADGYPIWYEDLTLLRLEKCLDPTAFCLNPQLTAPLPPPFVFPTNWPAEVFYWNATAKINDPNVDATMIMALEATLPIAAAGQQTVFARIRFTLNPRVAATANVPFTVTHPFGSITVTTRGIGQRLLVTQDVGVAAGIFTGALLDAAAGGVVNATGASIGPFLTAAPPALPRIKDPVTGNTYLSDGVTLVNVTGAIAGGVNAFNISGGGVVISEPTFTLVGKVSGCVAGTTPPVAVADPGAAAASGAAQILNVTANDTPGVTPAVVGPPPVAAAPIPLNKGSIVITVPPANGTAVKNLDGTVTYTPNPTFVGTDSFTYTVQDNCGVVSNALAVPVLVENLTVDRAEFRAKTGKWTVQGQSSAPAGSTMTVHKGAVPTGAAVIGTTTVKTDGTYKFVGKSKTAPASPTQPQSVSAQSAATVTRTQVLKVE